MTDIAVVNASPLIYLARAGHFDLLARRRGAIPNARAVLGTLRAAGMYLSDRVLDAALAEVGE